MRGNAASAGVAMGLSALVTLGTLVSLGGPTLAAKDPPAEGPGAAQARFTMSPVEGKGADAGGFVRLDTQTGQMSLCNRKDGQWLCVDMADQGRGLAEEVERLRGENKELKAEIRRMEDIMVGDGKMPDANRRAEGPPSGNPGGKFGLPSEKDVDQALGYMERMFRKFKDKMKEFESDNKGTPL